mmetsp:Transcript_4804/g.17292  ORF Transcript_4804/g.17292 Transcript_4804/m.17292 type:complete len:204 (+) Transcript_4804:160-771(+)
MSSMSVCFVPPGRTATCIGSCSKAMSCLAGSVATFCGLQVAALGPSGTASVPCGSSSSDASRNSRRGFLHPSHDSCSLPLVCSEPALLPSLADISTGSCAPSSRVAPSRSSWSASTSSHRASYSCSTALCEAWIPWVISRSSSDSSTVAWLPPWSSPGLPVVSSTKQLIGGASREPQYTCEPRGTSSWPACFPCCRTAAPDGC